MIYLDNASTTHKKPRCVIKAVKKGVTKYSVNSSRGGYALAIAGGLEIIKTREIIAKHFNADADNVVFTAGCTSAINLALRGTIVPNGHIITTAMEHNSVLRTLKYMKDKYNIDFTVIKPNKNGIIDPKEIEQAITPKTYLVATIHTSNVTGATNDIYTIGSICKKHHLLYFVDGAQSSGHLKVDMKQCNINLFTIAGHKGFYAPQGIGVLISNKVAVKPLIMGGTGTSSESINQPTSSPEGLESGTLSMPCILGLRAGVEYVNKHFNKLNTRIESLTTTLYKYLKNNDKIILYSLNPKSGVMSFNIKNMTSSEVGDILSEKYNICVRTGLHCAPLIHKANNTLSIGMVRVSLSAFNKSKDIKKLLKALNEITH